MSGSARMRLRAMARDIAAIDADQLEMLGRIGRWNRNRQRCLTVLHRIQQRLLSKPVPYDGSYRDALDLALAVNWLEAQDDELRAELESEIAAVGYPRQTWEPERVLPPTRVPTPREVLRDAAASVREDLWTRACERQEGTDGLV